MSANVYKLDLAGVLENKEFNDLIKVMGCNVGNKFDLSKLQFNKLIVASDADDAESRRLKTSLIAGIPLELYIPNHTSDSMMAELTTQVW